MRQKTKVLTLSLRYGLRHLVNTGTLFANIFHRFDVTLCKPPQSLTERRLYVLHVSDEMYLSSNIIITKTLSIRAYDL